MTMIAETEAEGAARRSANARRRQWALVDGVKAALAEVGFDELDTDGSNGTGWVGHYEPRAMDEAAIAKLEARLARLGMTRDGATWRNDRDVVRFRLDEIAGARRPVILTISHPDDPPRFVRALETYFEHIEAAA
jgi:hypothetical protein